MDREQWEQATEDERLVFLAEARTSTDSGRRYNLADVAAEAGIDLDQLGGWS